MLLNTQVETVGNSWAAVTQATVSSMGAAGVQMQVACVCLEAHCI